MQLRVNDRGPYVDGRIIDVSRRAAQLLGFEMAGTTPVRVRILKEESIQVAEAAKRGQTGNVMLAAATTAATPLLREHRPTPPACGFLKVRRSTRTSRSSTMPSTLTG